MKTQHPIRSLCEVLEVSASGYYDWRHRQAQPGPRAQENARLAQQIVQIHRASRKTSERCTCRISVGYQFEHHLQLGAWKGGFCGIEFFRHFGRQLIRTRIGEVMQVHG